MYQFDSSYFILYKKYNTMQWIYTDTFDIKFANTYREGGDNWLYITLVLKVFNITFSYLSI